MILKILMVVVCMLLLAGCGDDSTDADAGASDAVGEAVADAGSQDVPLWDSGDLGDVGAPDSEVYEDTGLEDVGPEMDGEAGD